MVDTFSVTLFRDHPAEGWHSMERYADGLLAGLYQVKKSLNVYEWVPPKPWTIPKGLMLSRILSYPYHARNYQSDINHVVDHSYGHLLFALDPRRTVVTIHDIAPILYPGKRLGLSGLAWRLAWYGTLKAGKLITVSKYTRRIILERFEIEPRRIVAIPEGVGPQFHPKDKNDLRIHKEQYAHPDVTLLLHVGNTQPRKNFDAAVQALALIRARGIDAGLVQVGGNPTIDQRSLISSLDLDKHIIFKGFVDDEELVDLYNIADLLVFPSFYEGFGFPPLESMACGTPVVVSNAASLPEVVGNSGLLVDPGSPEAFAEAIMKVLGSPEFARKLSEKGLERASNYTWHKTAEKTMNIYQSVWDLIESG